MGKRECPHKSYFFKPHLSRGRRLEAEASKVTATEETLDYG